MATIQRIGILTAGGDTPALNATLHGAVTRANEMKIEVLGLLRGFGSLFDPRVPHVPLNPLGSIIPELDPTRGGTILGASRDYMDASNGTVLDEVCDRLERLRIGGLICVGGDGTMNGLQPLCERIPTVLAPKTIDNDLGLNHPGESDGWRRIETDGAPGYRYEFTMRRERFVAEDMVNYVTPGYATAVFVSAAGVDRIRTTAESHRRIAIIEVMGRHSGYIALGTAYGQPDMILIPESPVHIERVVDRVRELYDLQSHAVIVVGEGIVDESGADLGAEKQTTDPAGNRQLSGAAEALRKMLIERIGDGFFQSNGKNDSARSAIFTRKVGHTQRGGRPLRFDRFCASQLGGKAVDMLLDGLNNYVATFQWSPEQGFYVSCVDGNRLRDRWGQIHARQVHPDLYDAEAMRPSPLGIEYLEPIFTNAIGHDDAEHVRATLFQSGNLHRRYHSVNVDIQKRTQFLPPA